MHNQSRFSLFRQWRMFDEHEHRNTAAREKKQYGTMDFAAKEIQKKNWKEEKLYVIMAAYGRRAQRNGANGSARGRER